MLRFDWLKQLKSRQSRRRRTGRRLVRHTAEVLQVRTLLSGNPVASVSKLDESEDEPDDDAGPEADLEFLVSQLNELSDEDVASLIENLDVEEEERAELTELVADLRSQSEEELAGTLSDLDEDEREELTEILNELLNGGDEDETDEDDIDDVDEPVDEDGMDDTDDEVTDEDEPDDIDDEDETDEGDETDDVDDEGPDEEEPNTDEEPADDEEPVNGDESDEIDDEPVDDDAHDDHEEEPPDSNPADDDHDHGPPEDDAGTDDDANGDHDHGSCGAHMDNPVLAGEHCAAMALATPESATHSAVGSGNWSDASVWANGTIPTEGADVYIPADVTLTVDGVVTETLHTIRIDGTLRFATDVDTQILVDTIIGAPGSLLEIGTEANPVAADVTARIIFADGGEIDQTWDPTQISRGAVLHGRTVMFGAEKTTWTTLAVQPEAGATTLELKEAPVGWRVGDELVVAGTDPNDPASDEVVRIAAITGTTVTLDQPLQRDHVAPLAVLDVHVANNTRNIQLSSENPELMRRGHVMFMHTLNVDVNYAGFYSLGRTDKSRPADDFSFSDLDPSQVNSGPGTNVRGRYSVHFHRGGTEATATPARVRGSVVSDNPGWGYVNHSATVDFISNVAYGVTGAAFNNEAGDERGSYVGNIALRIVNPNDPLNSDNEFDADSREAAQDFGFQGDGFWLQGAGTRLENNVVAGNTGTAYFYWPEGLLQPGLGQMQVDADHVPNGELLAGREDQNINTWWIPVAGFQNNAAYGVGAGLEVIYLHTTYLAGDDDIPQEYLDQLHSTFDGLTVWNSRGGGLKVSYTERVTFSNVRLHGVGGEDVVGVAANHYQNQKTLNFENVTVDGFGIGMETPPQGDINISGSFSNLIDFYIENPQRTPRTMNFNEITFGELPSVFGEDLSSERRHFLLNANFEVNDDKHSAFFLMPDRINLNFGEFAGQGLYFNEQRPDFVPMHRQPADSESVVIAPEFLGRTNQQLFDEFGLAFGGALLPADATQVAEVEGGQIGTAAEPATVFPPGGFVEDEEGDEPLDDEEDSSDGEDGEEEPDEVDEEGEEAPDADDEESGDGSEMPEDEHDGDDEESPEDDEESEDDEEFPEDEDEQDPEDGEETDGNEPGDDEEDSDESDPGSDDEPEDEDEFDDEGEDEPEDDEPSNEEDDAEDEEDEPTGDEPLDNPESEDEEDGSGEDDSPSEVTIALPSGTSDVSIEDGYLIVTQDGGIVSETPIAEVTSLVIQGTGDADEIIVDLRNGADVNLERLSVLAGDGDDTVRVLGLASQITFDVQVSGEAGNDLLIGSSGNDQFVGGDGHDTMIGGAGRDELHGGAGNDILIGNGGHDTLDGGTGDDFVRGDNGHDDLTAGSGADVLLGRAGNDKLRFTRGIDAANGGEGINQMLDDTTSEDAAPQPGGPTVELVLPDSAEPFALTLQNGSLVLSQNGEVVRRVMLNETRTVTITGSAAADELEIDFSRPGSVALDELTINGENGSDQITLTGLAATLAESVVMNGGDGDDVIRFDGSIRESATVNGGSGNDSITTAAGRDSIRGGDGNDFLDGGAQRDVIKGDRGHDRIFGRGGSDLLYGSSGHDTVIGNGGNDVIRGNSGNDIVRGSSGDDLLIGTGGNDFLRGGHGNDTLAGNDGDDTLFGSAGDDAITAGAGHDILFGHAGADVLVAGTGDDTAVGHAGNDVVLGEAGIDVVNGGGGDEDTLSGGEGLDEVSGIGSEVDENFTVIADWLDVI